MEPIFLVYFVISSLLWSPCDPLESVLELYRMRWVVRLHLPINLYGWGAWMWGSDDVCMESSREVGGLYLQQFRALFRIVCLNTIFCIKPYVCGTIENPDICIVWCIQTPKEQKNCRLYEHMIWHSSNTARTQTRNLFHDKLTLIPIGHLDCVWIWLCIPDKSVKVSCQYLQNCTIVWHIKSDLNQRVLCKLRTLQNT